MDFPLVLMSFGVGILIGLTGMGGAALMAPFLILAVGLQPITAVGTDLVYGAVTKIVGAWVHWKQGNVDLPVVRNLAAGSIPGGLAGAALVTFLPRLTHQAEAYVRKGIGTLLVLVGAILLTRMIFSVTGAPVSAERLRFLRGAGSAIWGAVVGFCVGATSVGSGSMLAPFLMVLFPKQISRVTGTDVFHAAILVTVTGLFYSLKSGVEWNLVPLLLAGSIPGVVIGSRLSVHVPAWPLRTGMAALLMVTGYRIF
jgi:uncharacterized protein